MFNVYSSTVTAKGQATIPVSLRKKLGIKPGQKIFFEERNGDILLQRPINISELRGSLKPTIKAKYTDKKADKAIGRMFALEYAKTR